MEQHQLKMEFQILLNRENQSRNNMAFQNLEVKPKICSGIGIES